MKFQGNYLTLIFEFLRRYGAVIAALITSTFIMNSCDKNSRNSEADKGKTGGDTRMYSLSELATKVRPSVFLLEVRDKNTSVIGSGTGFLINKIGWLVTNRHVIENAYSVNAKAENGARYQASGIIAFDLELDLVVLQLNSQELPYLSIQGISSDPPKVGEAVAVIGSPLGLEGTLSNGIISALRLESETNGTKVEYIQITAPISPGSSGSPVLRMNGGVIGIATLGSKAGSQNLNFAVPAHHVASLITAQTIIEFSEFKSTLYAAQIASSSEFSDYIKSRSNNDHKVAHSFAEDIVKRFPENPKSFLYLAKSLGSLKLYDEALKAIEKSLQIDPNYQDGLTELGWIQLNQNAHTNAVVSFQNSLSLSDKDASAWQGLGIGLKGLNRNGEAIDAFKKSAAIDPTNSYTWSGLGESLVAVDIFDRLGEAQSALEKAIGLDPDNVDSLLELGELLMRKNRFGDAITYFRKATVIDPQKEGIWQKLGDALERKGLLDEAERIFRKSVEIAPESHEALRKLGGLLTNNNKPDEAIIVLKKAFKMAQNQNDTTALIYSELGQAYLLMDNLDQAIGSFRNAISQYRESEFFWIGLGIAYVKNKLPDKALEAFVEGEKIAIVDSISDMRGLFWKEIVSELEKKQNKESSYLFCKRAIELQSTNNYIWYIYGKSLSYKGREPEAVIAYQKSLETLLEQPNAWCGLGFSQYKTGHLEEAQLSLRKAIKLKEIKNKEWDDFTRKTGGDPRLKVDTEIWNDAIAILSEDSKLVEPNNLVKTLHELMLEYNQ